MMEELLLSFVWGGVTFIVVYFDPYHCLNSKWIVIIIVHINIAVNCNEFVKRKEHFCLHLFSQCTGIRVYSIATQLSKERKLVNEEGKFGDGSIQDIVIESSFWKEWY